MRTATLYLFCSPGSTIYAVAVDSTGSRIPKLDAGSWQLRGQIEGRHLPDDVVVITNTQGYCLIDEAELGRRWPSWRHL